MLKHVSYRSSSTSLSRTGHTTLPRRQVPSSTTPSPTEMRRADISFAEGDFIVSSFEATDRYPPMTPPDNVSLMSLSSLKLSRSRATSVSSLADQATVPVKIYLRRLRSDMEYKTVSLSLRTTCRELVSLLLTKFRLRHRDPKLFFVLMEVTVRSPTDGAPVRRQLVLEDDARPAELQQCRPKGEANFSIGVRRGGLLRVHDAILNPGSLYKSLMVALETTSRQVVELLLDGCGSREDPKHYCLHEVSTNRQGATEIDRTLLSDDCPLQLQASWPKDGSRIVVLRRNIAFTLSMKSRTPWRRSADHSGSSDTESDCDTTLASLTASSSTLSSRTSASSSSSSGVFSEEGSPQSLPPSKAPLSRRPPRPVPRTLFPSRQKSASTTTLTSKEDVIPIVRDPLEARSSSPPPGRSLSRSFLNLNISSPMGRPRSRSFVSLLGSDPRTSTPKRPSTPGPNKDALFPAPHCICPRCFYI